MNRTNVMISSAVRHTLSATYAVCIALGVALANAAAESPFYLTFERSFSTQEPVQLRLDYTNREQPFQVRVLRPKSVENFLQGQFNISRSYEEPRASINPGHYLAGGINKLKSPTRSFQTLLSPEFRQGWQGTLSPPLKDPLSSTLVAPPKRVVHEPPAGFEIVKEIYLDMQRGGTEAQDQWWWFFDQAPVSGSYTVRSVSLGVLPPGLYLVQAVQVDDEAQALLQVSEISMQVKQSSRDLVATCIDRTGAPVAGVKISYRDGRGEWKNTGIVTDAHGVALIRSESDLDGRLIIKGEGANGSTAYADTDFVSLKPAASNMLILTDRPIFRPGDDVAFKGILRTSEKGALVSSSIHAHKPDLLRQDGTVASAAHDVRTSDFGTVSGVFKTSEEDTPGLYSVLLKNGEEPYAGELRIRDYVKPTFYVEVASHEGALRPGSTFKYTLRARRYAGGAPQGARYEVYVYRKHFDVPAFVEDAGGGLSAGSNYFGENRSTAALSQPQRIYSSVEARTPEDEREGVTESWGTAPGFDANGEATGEVILPPIPDDSPNAEWTYTILFRCMDREGAQAVVSENYFQTQAEGVVSGTFSKTVTKPGSADIRYNLRVTTPDGEPLSGVTGDVDFTLSTVSGPGPTTKRAFTTGTSGYATVEVPRFEHVGAVQAVPIARGDSRGAWRAEARGEPKELLIIGTAGEAVKNINDVVLYTDSTVLSPGEHASVFVLLPDVWGTSEKGALTRTVASDRVLAVESLKAEGRSLIYQTEAKEEYGTGFFETVTAPLGAGKFREATLGFRIIPWKKRLKLTIVPEKEIGEPMKPFGLKAIVHDSADQPVANAEVSLAVVDRAVYAVQPEFRPGLLDFFFPMPRLNLMTFYSDELQGYGYADTIRKPNFSLTAIKSQVKLSKRSLRDTAGWFPHLVTNAAGEVAVTVDMPANLTEWTVTGTVVDNSGRIGEAQGRYRTAVDIETEARVPSFLRVGDSVEVPVVTRNALARGVKVSTEGAAKQGDTVIASLHSASEEITPSGSATRILPIKAESSKDTFIELSTKVEDDARTGGPREFEISTKRAALPVVLTSAESGSGSISFPLPKSAITGELSIVITKGLLGAILSRAHDLLTYPYGCAEQLAHSISPNLALMQLEEKIPDLARNLTAFGSLASKAKENVRAGLKRLAPYQKQSGGYSLWPSDPDASPFVTMLVVSTLKKASQRGVSEADTPLSKAEAYLESVVSEGERTPFELVELSGGGASQELAAAQADFVKRVLKEEKPSLAEVVYALKMYFRYRDISWHQFNRNIDRLNVSGELGAKLLALVEKDDLNTVELSPTLITREPIGFSYSRSELLSALYGVLWQLPTRSEKAIAKVRNQIVRDLKEGLLWSPLDLAALVEEVTDSSLKELATQLPFNAAAISAKDGSGNVIAAPVAFQGGLLVKTDREGTTGRDLSKISFSGLSGDYAIYGHLEAEIPYGDLAPLSQGVSVSRRLLRVTPTGTVPLKDGDRLTIGDVVVSEVVVSRTDAPQSWRGAGPSDWFVVEDSVPSFAELIDDDKTYLADAKIVKPEDTYWSSLKETLRYPDRVDRVVRLSGSDKYTSYAVWRVAFAGEAKAGPARAFNMYVKGNEGSTTSVDLVSSKSR